MTTEDGEMKLFLICTNYWDTADTDMWMGRLRKWNAGKLKLLLTERMTLCAL